MGAERFIYAKKAGKSPFPVNGSLNKLPVQVGRTGLVLHMYSHPPRSYITITSHHTNTRTHTHTHTHAQFCIAILSPFNLCSLAWFCFRFVFVFVFVFVLFLVLFLVFGLVWFGFGLVWFWFGLFPFCFAWFAMSFFSFLFFCVAHFPCHCMCTSYCFLLYLVIDYLLFYFLCRFVLDSFIYFSWNISCLL